MNATHTNTATNKQNPRVFTREKTEQPAPEQTAAAQTPALSAEEIAALLKLKAEVELRKKKASEASKASRKQRLEKASEEQKKQWREAASKASKASNMKKKAEIEEMKAKLAKFEAQQQQAA